MTLYTLESAGCAMPSIPLPVMEPGWRLAWPGEAVQNGQVWVESIRRWVDLDGPCVVQRVPLDARLRGCDRVVRVRT